MNRFRILKRVMHDVRGTSAVELGIICAVIVLAMFTALAGVASETAQMWNSVNAKSQAAREQ